MENVQSMYCTKHATDCDMEAMSGQFIDCADDWQIVCPSFEYASTRVVKPDGNLLCCILWKAIPITLCDLAHACYADVAKTYNSTNRGTAAGIQHRIRTSSNNYDKGIVANSGIIGYIDSTNHKRPCRLTAYSKEHFDIYNKGLPFINAINECFKRCVPDSYDKQLIAAQKTQFRIPHTAFSTVTVNYNFRTALHRDSGDFKEGFGNIVVVSNMHDPGMLLFPQFKVGIKLQSGDFMAMDVHEWHCNSALHICDDAYRLSFVSYLREKMHMCDVINNRLMAINGNLDGKTWNSDKLIIAIIGQNATKVSLGSGPPPANLEWWRLTSEDERYILDYKNKRYTLYDKVMLKKVHNLIPAWEYVNDNGNNSNDA